MLGQSLLVRPVAMVGPLLPVKTRSVSQSLTYTGTYSWDSYTLTEPSVRPPGTETHSWVHTAGTFNSWGGERRTYAWAPGQTLWVEDTITESQSPSFTYGETDSYDGTGATRSVAGYSGSYTRTKYLTATYTLPEDNMPPGPLGQRRTRQAQSVGVLAAVDSNTDIADPRTRRGLVLPPTLRNRV